jgi:protein-arginine kinase activator protein McsA
MIQALMLKPPPPFYFLIIALCEQCQQNPSQAIFNLASRQQLTQQRFRKMLQICQDCSTISPLDAISVSSDADAMADIPCDSLDCPGFYERLKAKKDVQAACSYSSLIEDFFSSS